MVRHVPSLLLALSLLAGCHTAPVRQGQLERQVADSRLNSLQLRRLVDDYVVRFVHEVENGADRILDQTDDPSLQRNAILWKSNAISACLRAGSRPDALGAYLDVAVLTTQMRYLFESPAGSVMFGPYRGEAVHVAMTLDAPLREIEQTLGSSQSFRDDLVERLAVEYPIRDLSFDRESLTARFVDLIMGPTHQMREVVTGLEESVADARRMAVLYAEILPKQARWQAQLALLDATTRAPIATVLNDIHGATEQAGRIAEFTERLPELLAQERETVVQFAQAERMALTRDIDSMRRESQQFVHNERELLVADLREERLAAMRDIHGEVIATTRAAEQITQRVTDDMVRQSDALLTRVFKAATDLLQYAALILLALTGIVVWFKRHRRSRRPVAESKLPIPMRVVRPAA